MNKFRLSFAAFCVCELLSIVFAEGSVAPVTSNVTQCWECSNDVNGVYNAQCPINASVDESRAFQGPCSGKCFTRTDSTDTKVVNRGCTSGQWGLPSPLPPDGCYMWEAKSQVWCLCGGDGCNSVKMGEAGNVTFEQHVQHTANQATGQGGQGGQGNDTVLPPSLSSGNRTSGQLLCWQCLSDFKGQHYSQCPLHETVNVRTAYIGNCTGRCFMHNTTDNTGLEIMVRGCTGSQWGLPDPLPADGCYPWYSETWCVCSTDGCNGVALGTPGSVEFDFHLHRDSNHAQLPARSTLLWLLALAIPLYLWPQ